MVGELVLHEDGLTRGRCAWLADSGQVSMMIRAGSRESEGGGPHPRQHKQTKQNTMRERQTGDHREHREGGNTRENTWGMGMQHFQKKHLNTVFSTCCTWYEKVILLLKSCWFWQKIDKMCFYMLARPGQYKVLLIPCLHISFSSYPGCEMILLTEKKTPCMTFQIALIMKHFPKIVS